MPLLPWDEPYRPSSVIFGRDRDVVIPLLRMQAPGLPEPRILDVTYGGGVMWQKMPVLPIERTDIFPDDPCVHRKPHPPLTRVCDCRALPEEWQHCFDVVVFDIPHRPNSGPNAKNRERYGFDAPDLHHVRDVTHFFEPFLLQAQRVLVHHGIVLAKMANMNHSGVTRYQCDALRATATQLGMRACTSIIKVDPSRGERKFKGRILHPKMRHSEWIVIRNSWRCARAA